jgi:hypothetical protein
MKNVKSIELLPHVVTTRADKNDFTSLDRVKRKMASLNDVCFERVRDTFYYGMFGEFKLVVDKKTGCFNATKLCNEGGKKFRNWTCLEKSKRLMEYFDRQNSGGQTYEVKGGDKNELISKTTGQYVCKELILDIASWVSVEFYDKCNRIIVDFYVAEYKKKLDDNRVVIKQKDDKIDELMKHLKESDKRHANMILRLEESNKRLEESNKRLGIKLDDMADKNDELLERNETIVDQNNRLETRVVSIQTKLDVAVEDRAPQPDRIEAREHFILLKRNDDDYPYYTIRAQEVNARNALRRQEQLYDKTTVLLDIDLQPNSKTLYVRIKDDLRARGVAFRYCKISIEESDVTEAELIEAMRAINDEKRRVS